MPFSGEYPQYSNESPKKEGGERGMLSWLQPFLGGGRLVIHVMDSLDSLAAAAEC